LQKFLINKGLEMTHAKVIVIGAGPAGYTAAIYAARANLKPIQLLGPQPGGQLTITTDVENFPGFKETIQGPWLMEQMHGQAEHVGTDMRFESVVNVDFSKKPFVIETDAPNTYTCDSVIIATGAQAKWIGLESETYFRGYGVSGCATCDGFFFKNKQVAVIGGGNSAVEEAIYLTNHCAHVTLIHRRDSLRAEKIAQERLFKNPKISVIWDSAVDEVIGVTEPFKRVTGLKVRNLKTNELQTLNVEGVFVAIGHTPMSEPFKDQLKLDHEGYILTTSGSTATSISGVFAAGDVQDKIFRQAVTAAGQGCMAALEAEKFLSH
jgi:thioredoxin reductase (NADPH)